MLNKTSQYTLLLFSLNKLLLKTFIKSNVTISWTVLHTNRHSKLDLLFFLENRDYNYQQQGWSTCLINIQCVIVTCKMDMLLWIVAHVQCVCCISYPCFVCRKCCEKKEKYFFLCYVKLSLCYWSLCVLVEQGEKFRYIWLYVVR